MVTIYNRKYFKLDLDNNNPLKNKVPYGHISLIEFYVPTGNVTFNGGVQISGNQINGRFNSTVHLPAGNPTLRNRIITYLNNNNITFEPKSLVKMGTSNWLGTQMQMLQNGNPTGFDILTEYIIDQMWTILNNMNLVATREIKRIQPGNFNWVQGGVVTQNTSYLYMEEWKNNIGNTVLYIKIYSPANPHISIASLNDFKLGVTPGGFQVNGSKMEGGGITEASSDYKPQYSSFIRLA